MVFLLALFLGPNFARLPLQTDYSSLEQRLGSSIQQLMRDNDVPGVAIGLVDGERLVWSQGFGYANVDKKIPVTPDTIFSLQSVSKSYTATAFLEAVDHGLIKLDDRLTKVLPGFKVNDRFGGQVDRITMRHLLSHWSGLCHEAPVGNNYGDWHCSFDAHVASIQDTWLRFPVGTRYRYSNLGIDLAGYCLSRRDQMPFEDLMRVKILDPLGMTHSSFRRSDVAGSPQLATGYEDPQTPVPPLEIPMVAAGGLYSTVDDMAKYVEFQLADGFINGKRWLSEKSIETMRTPQFGDRPRGRGYGIGLQIRPYHGGTKCWHGGGGYGFGTIQAWVPEYKIGVIVLTNSDSGGDLAEDVADQALTGMIALKQGTLPPDGPCVTDSRPVVNLSTIQLERFIGAYKATSGLASFALVDGRLHFRRQRADIPLVAHSPTEFTDSEMTQSYLFDLGADGWPTGVLQLGDNGSDYMAFNDRPNEPEGPNLPQWKAWTGAYAATAYGQLVTRSLTLRNGYLYWDGSLKLFPYRNDLFFTADGDSVEVQPDGSIMFGNRKFQKRS